MNVREDDNFGDQVKAVLTAQHGRCEMDEFVSAFCKMYKTRPPQHPSCWQALPEGVALDEDYIFLNTQEVHDNEDFTPETRNETQQSRVITTETMTLEVAEKSDLDTVSCRKNVITLVDNTKTSGKNVITLVDNTKNESQNVDELDLVDELFKENILEIMKAHGGKCDLVPFRNEFKKMYGKHLWQHLNQPSRWLNKFNKDFSFHRGANCYVSSSKHKTSVIGTKTKGALDKNSGNNEENSSFENQVKAVLAKQNGRCDIDLFMDAFFQTYNKRPVHPSCWQEVPQGVYVQDSYILQVMPQGVGIKDNYIFLVTQEMKDKDKDAIIIIDDNDDKTPEVKKNTVVEKINNLFDNLLIKRIIDIMKANDGKCEVYKFCNEFKKSYGFFPKPPNKPAKWLDQFPNNFCFIQRDRCFGFVNYVPSGSKAKSVLAYNQDKDKDLTDKGLRQQKALTIFKHLYKKKLTKYLFVENLSPDTEEDALRAVFNGCAAVRIFGKSRKPCSNSVVDEIKKKYNSSGTSIQEIQEKYNNPRPKWGSSVQDKKYTNPTNTDSQSVSAGVTSGDQRSSQQEEIPCFALLEFIICKKATSAFHIMSGKTINGRQVHLEFAADKGSEGFVLQDKEELLPIKERQQILKDIICDSFKGENTKSKSKKDIFHLLKSRYQDLDCKEFCQEFFNISDKEEVFEIFNDVLKFDETNNMVTLQERVLDKGEPVKIVESDKDCEIDCEIAEDVPYNMVTLNEGFEQEVLKDEAFISNLTMLLSKNNGVILKAHTLKEKYLAEFGTAPPHSLRVGHKMIKRYCPDIEWPSFNPSCHIMIKPTEISKTKSAKQRGKRKRKKKNVLNLTEDDPNTKFEYSQTSISEDKPLSAKQQHLKDIICGFFKPDPKIRFSNKGFFKKLRSKYPKIDQREFVQECFDISDKQGVFEIFDDILKVDGPDNMISLLVPPEQEKQVAVVVPMVALAKQADAAVTPMVALARQADVDQKRQELLAKQIQQQKLLIDTLEKKKATMSDAEREGLMAALRKISETVDTVLTTVSKKPVSGAGKALAAAQTKTACSNQESNGQVVKAQNMQAQASGKGFKGRRAFSRYGNDSKQPWPGQREGFMRGGHEGHQGHGQGGLGGPSSTFHKRASQHLIRPLMQTPMYPCLEGSKVRRIEMPPERASQPLKRPLMQQTPGYPYVEGTKVRRIEMPPGRMRNNVPEFNQRSMQQSVQGYRGNQEIIQRQYIESGDVRPDFSDSQQMLTEERHIKTSYRHEIYKETHVIEKVHRPSVYMEDIQCGLSNIDKIQRELEEKKQRELKIIEERLKELQYLEEQQSIEERLRELRDIEERQREPRFREERQQEPILREDWHREPILREDRHSKLGLREERQREPSFKEERQREPIFREESQREPIFREERQREPIFREERQRELIFRAERQREPIFREESQQEPIFKEERQREPIFREERQQEHIFGDERHTLVTYPGFGGVKQGRQQQPISREERHSERRFREEKPKEPSFREEKHTLVTYPGFGGVKPRLPNYMAERPVEPTYRNVGPDSREAHNLYTRGQRRGEINHFRM